MPRLRLIDHLLICAYWLGQNFFWGALVGPVVVKQVSILQPENPASVLWIPGTIGGIPALIVPLLAGPWSDRCTSRLGRRRPFLLLGAAGTVVSVAVLAYGFQERSLPVYLLGLLLAGIPTNIALAAYSGIIPDLVPVQERGMASGLMAMVSLVGSMLGVLAGAAFVDSGRHGALFATLAGVYVACCLVSVWGVKETPLERAPPKTSFRQQLASLWIDPREHPDFGWVWITRAAMKLGFYLVITCLLFYFADVLRAEKPATASANMTALALVLAAVSGVVAGRWSDRIGRKRIVTWSSYAIGASALLFLACREIGAAMAVGAVFGLAYGAYSSVDWALASDVLPNPDGYAKDMAVWHVAEVLPQQAASLMGNALLATLPGAMVMRGGELAQSYRFEAYVVLFSLAAALFLAGGWMIRHIKGSS